jgi:hypothetical protein
LFPTILGLIDYQQLQKNFEALEANHYSQPNLQKIVDFLHNNV